MQVYDHEFFSPLGDALIAAWEMANPDVKRRRKPNAENLQNGNLPEGRGDGA